MARRITVVVSQAQSQNPKKRAVEEAIVGELLGARGIDVAVVPHLYDIKADSPALLGLSTAAGDLVICSWLYPRAAFWTLDRNGIDGHFGETLIPAYGESEEDDEDEGNAQEQADKERVADGRQKTSRKIYCLDLRTHDTAAPYLAEIRRISAEANTQTIELTSWINGNPKPEQMERYLSNGNGSNGHAASTEADPISLAEGAVEVSGGENVVNLVGDNLPSRRWYPVIDYSRCTNCMECIDFCLFGVYGLDQQETLLVEQPDNCRKGCPACSRVCPENAIIFPQHKTPTIAGSPEVAGAMKIDLSKLFGAPDPGAPGADKAVDVAVRERDEQLLRAGRDVVGETVGIARRQPEAEERPKDDLDDLIDQLDEIDI